MKNQLKLKQLLTEKYSPEKMTVDGINFTVGVYFGGSSGNVVFTPVTPDDVKKVKQDSSKIRGILKSKASSVVGPVVNTKTLAGDPGEITFMFKIDPIEKELEKRIATK